MLDRIRLFNWLFLIAMTIGGWLAFSAFVGRSILIGGIVVTISFACLKRDLTGLFGGPLQAVKARFFIKYYARLSVLVLILFFLIKYQVVHVVALLVGLSTVLFSIGITAGGEAKKIFCDMKEAS